MYKSFFDEKPSYQSAEIVIYCFLRKHSIFYIFNLYNALSVGRLACKLYGKMRSEVAAVKIKTTSANMKLRKPIKNFMCQ